MQLGGTAVVTSGSGSVTADSVAGSLTVTTSSSSVTARAAAGDLRVRTKSGAVDAACPVKATRTSKPVPVRFG